MRAGSARSVQTSPAQFVWTIMVHRKIVSKMAWRCGKHTGCGSASNYSSGSILLAAILAGAVDLKSMAGGVVMVFPTNLLLKLVDFGRKKFHRAAASCADHVVMAAPIVLVLVAGDTVMESHFACQPALR